MTPRVAVLVVTYNSADVVERLVESLPAGLGAGTSWELVTVDNASTDGTTAVLDRIATRRRQVQTGHNAGYAAAVNAGAAAAGECDAYLVLNPDVRLDPDCVPTLLSALESSGAGIAVPRLRDARGKLIFSMRRRPSLARALGDAIVGAERAGRSRYGEVVSDPAAYEHEQKTDWAEGSTQLVSSACWDRCAPWDESFFLYSEETDFDLRAGAAGFPVVFVPTAGAVHLEGGSATSAPLWALVQLNRVRLYRRGAGRVSATVFWLTTLAREASRALLGRHHNRVALDALLDRRLLTQTPGPHTLEQLTAAARRRRTRPSATAGA